jgi:hypothetical protein
LFGSSSNQSQDVEREARIEQEKRSREKGSLGQERERELKNRKFGLKEATI